MEHSLMLAKLIGVILVIGPVVKTVRHKQFVEACERASESPTAIFVIGGVVFILSTAFVLSHSVWFADWRLMVTLIGWLCSPSVCCNCSSRSRWLGQCGTCRKRNTASWWMSLNYFPASIWFTTASWFDWPSSRSRTYRNCEQPTRMA